MRSTTILSSSAVLAIAVVSLTACSGGDEAGGASSTDEGTRPVTASTSPAGGSASGGTSEGSTSPAGGTSTSSTSTSTAGPGGTRQLTARRDAAFVTPSGNISCFIGDGGNEVRCEVIEPTWQPRAADRYDCDFDLGSSVVITDGKAKLGCISDTIQGLAKPGEPATGWWDSSLGTKNGMAVLPYGSSISYNDITCESKESGVSCVETGDGVGFDLSRQSYQLRDR